MNSENEILAGGPKALGRHAPQTRQMVRLRQARSPWRRTTDPYAIAVSEFMLQQTQVVTVIPYYQRWLKFPDLAGPRSRAEPAVIKAWEGLGYYRRARNLHALARPSLKPAAIAALRRKACARCRASAPTPPPPSAASPSACPGRPRRKCDPRPRQAPGLRDEISRPQTRANCRRSRRIFG